MFYAIGNTILGSITSGSITYKFSFFLIKQHSVFRAVHSMYLAGHRCSSRLVQPLECTTRRCSSRCLVSSMLVKARAAAECIHRRCSSRCSGISMLARLVQPPNAEFANARHAVRDCRCSQGSCNCENAHSPMLVTLFGISMLVRLVQPHECIIADARHAVRDIDARKARAAH